MISKPSRVETVQKVKRDTKKRQLCKKVCYRLLLHSMNNALFLPQLYMDRKKVVDNEGEEPLGISQLRMYDRLE